MHEESPTETRPPSDALPAGLAGAVDYLRRCLDEQHKVAVLTGGSPTDVRLVIETFSAGLPSAARVVRTLAPVNSAQVFLHDILGQFDIGAADATADELQRLLTVVLRQGARRGAPTVLVVSDLQDFGPRALETIREVVRSAYSLDCAPLVVFTGHAGLNRVLDSPGMAEIGTLTRMRWDLDQPDGSNLRIADARGRQDAPPPVRTELVVSRDHEIIGRFPVDRDRLLIGRSQLSDICLAGRFISRQHALLLRSSDGLWVIDLKSTNGTIVNAELVDRRRVAHGDIISLGGYQLRIENEPQAEEPGEARTAIGDDHSRTVVMRSLQGIGRTAPAAGEAASPPSQRPSAA